MFVLRVSIVVASIESLEAGYKYRYLLGKIIHGCALNHTVLCSLSTSTTPYEYCTGVSNPITIKVQLQLQRRPTTRCWPSSVRNHRGEAGPVLPCSVIMQLVNIVDSDF